MRAFHCLACAAALLVLGGCSTLPRPVSPAYPAPTAALSDTQAHDIAIHALGLVGTPYHYGGNTPESGFDCSGLIAYVYRHSVGQTAPRTVAQLSSWGQPIAGSALRSGDLVLFGSAHKPSHAGIYVGQGRFVHAPASGGRVRIDNLHSHYWAQQNAAFRRL